MHLSLKRAFVISFGLLLSCAGLSALERTVSLGGRDGWSLVDEEQNFRIVRGRGRYGYDCMTLDTNSRRLSSDTDLLIDFEGDDLEDRAGNYRVVTNSIMASGGAKMGKGAGLSRGNGGLRLSGGRGALFGTTGFTTSFIIEFWLNPAVAENGEKVFSWRSSKNVGNSPIYQMMSASFYKNHLEWTFTNVFEGYEKDDGELSLSSYSTLIPDEWTHHAISYDVESGLLEYRINGRIEAMRYITSNGQELGGDVYRCNLGVVADIDICPQYTGLIDDFHIRRSNESESAQAMRYDIYDRDGGRFVTKPIKISPNAELVKVDALLDIPSQTDVMLYVRSGNNQFEWTDSYPEWIPVTNHSQIKNVKGLYFQLAVDLFPDGGGAVTPSVMNVALNFKEIDAPLPPFRVTAVASDSSVTLSWTYSVDKETGGYYVYYGERPGEYLGKEAVEGVSPINVGNLNSITFNGLKNGKIYYFAVAAYSNVNDKIMGVLSKEVYARPLNKSSD
ncbi:MAG: fibronectin type III domain-containing protein [Treponema sp.]|nr:fibronectin type III domain-containing protein [Treponema sp.]